MRCFIKRITVCIFFPLLVWAFLLVLSPVGGSQCILVKNLANCGGMYLNEIPKSLPMSITELDLSNNYLENTDWTTLSRYRKTKILTIKNSSVDAVPANAFQKLQQLMHVDLSYNRLTHVDSQIFTFNTKLKELLLNGNKLKFHFKSPFLISYSITHLELRDCGVEQISSITFRDMKRLEYLDLSKTEINILDSQTFNYNVFGKLKIYPGEEILNELSKVCRNGAVVLYPSEVNWCEAMKSKEIETTTTVATSEGNSVATWVLPVIAVMLVVLNCFCWVYSIYIGVRVLSKRKRKTRKPQKCSFSDDEVNDGYEVPREDNLHMVLMPDVLPEWPPGKAPQRPLPLLPLTRQSFNSYHEYEEIPDQ